MCAGLLIFGDDFLRLGGDVMITVLSTIAIVVCQVLFVGRRKLTAAVAPAPALAHASAPAEGGDDNSTQDDTAGKGGDQPKKGRSSEAMLFSLLITVLYVFLYMFVIVPLFTTLTDLHKLIFRLVAHPFVVVTGDMVLRKVATTPSDQSPLIDDQVC